MLRKYRTTSAVAIAFPSEIISYAVWLYYRFAALSGMSRTRWPRAECW
jgi:transposase-like protein